MNVQGVPVDLAQTVVTLPAAAGSSDAADLHGSKIVGFVTPEDLVSTSLTFEASLDGVTYYPLYDESGAEILIDCGPEQFISVLIDYFRAVRFIKLVTTATEGATRAITIVSIPRV